MKQAVFLDVDYTLIITITNPDRTRQRIINEELLNYLQAANLKDIYLFTNMDLSDMENIHHPSRITRKALVDLLIKKGFKVHGVITPADPAYQHGPGAAYHDFYLQAYQKRLKEKNYDTEKNEFNRLANLLPLEEEYQGKRREEGQKRAMFRYFLQHKPSDLKSILYFDDSQECLSAVKSVSADVKIATFQIKPEKLMSDCEERERQYYSNEHVRYFLQYYIQQRREEQESNKSQYNSFAARIYSLFSIGREANLKISAATKCLHILNGEHATFSSQELKTFLNGRLKNIVENNFYLTNELNEIHKKQSATICEKSRF